MIEILIADDHTLLRHAVRDLLTAEPDFRITGDAGTGGTAVAVAARTQPDVVLLDLEMPDGPPGRTVTQIRERSPGSRIIVLTAHDDFRLIQEMLLLDVDAFLHKSVGRDELVRTIREVAASGPAGPDRFTVHVSRSPAGRAVDADHPDRARPDRAGHPGLSPREHEVLQLVRQALTNRQIAARLSISEGTVKRHLRNTFGKLGAVSRIDAVNKGLGPDQPGVSRSGVSGPGVSRPGVADRR
jgi:two-component system nitrate/nitrite response regulator NarL